MTSRHGYISDLERTHDARILVSPSNIPHLQPQINSIKIYPIAHSPNMSNSNPYAGRPGPVPFFRLPTEIRELICSLAFGPRRAAHMQTATKGRICTRAPSEILAECSGKQGSCYSRSQEVRRRLRKNSPDSNFPKKPPSVPAIMSGPPMLPTRPGPRGILALLISCKEISSGVRAWLWRTTCFEFESEASLAEFLRDCPHYLLKELRHLRITLSGSLIEHPLGQAIALLRQQCKIKLASLYIRLVIDETTQYKEQNLVRVARLFQARRLLVPVDDFVAVNNNLSLTVVTDRNAYRFFYMDHIQDMICEYESPGEIGWHVALLDRLARAGDGEVGPDRWNGTDSRRFRRSVASTSGRGYWIGTWWKRTAFERSLALQFS